MSTNGTVDKPKRAQRRAKVPAPVTVGLPGGEPLVDQAELLTIASASVPELPAGPVEPEPEMPVEPPLEPEPLEIAAVAPQQTIPTPSAIVAETIETEEIIMQDELNTTINAGANAAETVFAKVQGGAKEAVAKGQAFVAEAADFGKGNVEAMMEAGRISARGFESLAQDNAAYTKASFETATSTMKSAATLQSPTELFKLQGDYLRGAFDAWVAQASKNTEAMLKLANEATQPLSNRVALAAEKIKLAA